MKIYKTTLFSIFLIMTASESLASLNCFNLLNVRSVSTKSNFANSTLKSVKIRIKEFNLEDKTSSKYELNNFIEDPLEIAKNLSTSLSNNEALVLSVPLVKLLIEIQNLPGERRGFHTNFYKNETKKNLDLLYEIKKELGDLYLEPILNLRVFLQRVPFEYGIHGRNVVITSSNFKKYSYSDHGFMHDLPKELKEDKDKDNKYERTTDIKEEVSVETILDKNDFSKLIGKRVKVKTQMTTAEGFLVDAFEGFYILDINGELVAVERVLEEKKYTY